MKARSVLSDDMVSTIQDLMKLNIDSRDGFHEAAEHVDDAAIKDYFRAVAAERQQQLDELRALVKANTEEDAESVGTFAAAAHRAWMDLRGMMGAGTQEMLHEAERGEDHIKGEYESAVETVTGGAAGEVIRRHFVAVKRAHDRVRELRDSYHDAR
jgi:uncharacterized protein (TIGR02284 family)